MVFGFFKKKKKEDSQDQITAIVEELVKIESEQNNEESVNDVLDETISSNEIESLEEKEDQEENFDTSITESNSSTDSLEETYENSSSLEGIETIEQSLMLLENESLEQVSETKLDAVSIDAEKVETPKKLSWAARLKNGLSKTRNTLGKGLLGVFGGGQIDEDLYEELETILLTSDVGLPATTHLLDDVRKKVSIRGLKDSTELKLALSDSLIDLIKPIEAPLDVSGHTPYVIMVVGVNGAGKTTSIGKLAKYFQSQGKSVMLAAGDTFRAAAREQLMEWGKRNNVTVVTQQSGDSAAVCFDAIQSAIAKKVDIVLADTAGRLPTQLNLMEEIKKVKRVISKAIPNAPHEIMLVLDANIGQNALNQVHAFDDALGLTGLVLTKLDGTAKGGIICAIAKERPIPLRFIGVGESIDDLRPFNAKDYVDILLESTDN